MRRILNIAAGVAFLVFLAWLIVPNVLVARNRSRQKRTMVDIRSIATAWEARATAVNSYSVSVLQSSHPVRSSRMPAERRVTSAELARSLEPTYIRRLPRTDAWGTDFQFTIGEFDREGRAETYMIRSLGSDGSLDRSAHASGPTKTFADDIIYSNGSYIQYPEDAG
jgi:hypothetical protein